MTAAHVVVDARMVADGGVGTYLQNLLPRIAERRRGWRFTAFVPTGRQSSVTWRDQSNVATQFCDAPIYSIREQFELPRRIPADAKLYWSPNYNIPLLTRAPLVVTVHDVAHLAVRDLNDSVIGRAYARLFYGSVRRKARGVLFDSEFSRAEMSRLVGPVAHGVVAPLGVDPRWAGAKISAGPRPIAGPYAVYVGNMKRHKNVPALIAAFRQIESRVPHRLVLIGRSEGIRKDPDLAIATDDRVTFAGELSEQDLLRYVAHADAFVTASKYEGFGLPAVEAMAAGVPCLVSRAGSLPEVCGDAALYCDPNDIASIGTNLLRVLTDEPLRRELRKKGEDRVRNLSWDACADVTLGVFEQALAS